ncbi:MAG TPA: hypothetical protein VI544_02100 [Candidatus Nanoarchaeia archaeon]|nr:hypothetical protein [Candidatus Nanoarchaeia archaeon]
MAADKEKMLEKEENPFDEVMKILDNYEKGVLPRSSQECCGNCSHEH